MSTTLSLFDGLDDQEGNGKDERLARQLVRVYETLAAKPAWFTLADLARATSSPEASVSARIRDLRKPRFGGFIIQHRPDVHGQHWYWLIPDSGDSALVYRPEPEPRSMKAEARHQLRNWLDGQPLTTDELRTYISEVLR